MMVRLASALLFLLLLAGWEVYCRAAGVSALVVPLPSAVLRTLWDGLAGLEERFDTEAVASPSGVVHLTLTRRR